MNKIKACVVSACALILTTTALADSPMNIVVTNKSSTSFNFGLGDDVLGPPVEKNSVQKFSYTPSPNTLVAIKIIGAYEPAYNCLSIGKNTYRYMVLNPSTYKGDEIDITVHFDPARGRPTCTCTGSSCDLS